MIKTCRYCGEEFELKPGKPGYADECPTCLIEKTIFSDPLPRFTERGRKLVYLWAEKESGGDQEKRDRLIREFARDLKGL